MLFRSAVTAESLVIPKFRANFSNRETSSAGAAIMISFTIFERSNFSALITNTGVSPIFSSCLFTPFILVELPAATIITDIVIIPPKSTPEIAVELEIIQFVLQISQQLAYLRIVKASRKLYIEHIVLGEVFSHIERQRLRLNFCH